MPNATIAAIIINRFFNFILLLKHIIFAKALLKNIPFLLTKMINNNYLINIIRRMSAHTENLDAYFFNKQKQMYPHSLRIRGGKTETNDKNPQQTTKTPIIQDKSKLVTKLSAIELNNKSILQGKLALADKLAKTESENAHLKKKLNILEEEIKHNNILKMENDRLYKKIIALEEELTFVENIVDRMYDASACNNVSFDIVDDIKPSNKKDDISAASEKILIEPITIEFAQFAKGVINNHINGMNFHEAFLFLHNYGLTLCAHLPDNDCTKYERSHIYVSLTNNGNIKEICYIGGLDVRNPY